MKTGEVITRRDEKEKTGQARQDETGQMKDKTRPSYYTVVKKRQDKQNEARQDKADRQDKDTRDDARLYMTRQAR